MSAMGIEALEFTASFNPVANAMTLRSGRTASGRRATVGDKIDAPAMHTGRHPIPE
jgi:hypothetical protein